jgi:hypothetical protein
MGEQVVVGPTPLVGVDARRAGGVDGAVRCIDQLGTGEGTEQGRYGSFIVVVLGLREGLTIVGTAPIRLFNRYTGTGLVRACFRVLDPRGLYRLQNRL